MPPTSWKLAQLLFEKMPQRIPFCDLAAPVFGDREEFVDSDLVGTHRKNANNYFREHGIPLKVCTSQGNAYMETVKE